MKIGLLLHTVRHLKAKQLVYQVLYRLHKPSLKNSSSPIDKVSTKCLAPIVKYPCWDKENFCFINLKAPYQGWNNTKNGMLWAYNQNYMDWLGQEKLNEAGGENWIDKFNAEIGDNNVGLDPYPIALRSINWIKFFCKYPESGTKKRLDALYSQVRLMEKKIEFHLMGNHLLEDYYALFIAALFFKEERMYNKYSKGLREQLDEQILPDGAHYEQSPMYHCIMLDRLLDCYNLSISNAAFEGQESMNVFLLKKAQQMLGHLKSIVWEDGSIPLLNDSAYEIAPTANQIFGYADRLGISFNPIQMKECGYRKLRNKRMEAIVDVGNVTATYQPGHSHADTFNFELRVDDEPLIVDTGISTYNKTARRLYERSTAAHNTVTIDGRNSSEVWSGFRIGKRAEVTLKKDDVDAIEASHNGFGNVLHKRKFSIDENSFIIEDSVNGGDATLHLHFSPERTIKVEGNRIKTNNCALIIEHADTIDVVEDAITTRYNELISTKLVVIKFRKLVRTTFRIDK